MLGQFGERAVFPDYAETALKEEFFGDRTGYFVDVGANDPKDISQTWHLEQKGWRGILIEPQPALDRPLAHDNIMLLAAGEIGQGVGKLRVAHHP